MLNRLIIPISICAMALAAVLQGLLFADEGRSTAGLVCVVGGIVTIAATVILHKHGKL